MVRGGGWGTKNMMENAFTAKIDMKLKSTPNSLKKHYLDTYINTKITIVVTSNTTYCMNS